MIDANQEIGGHVADLDAQERLYATQLEDIEKNVAELWTQQKAGKWPIAWITPPSSMS